MKIEDLKISKSNSKQNNLDDLFSNNENNITKQNDYDEDDIPLTNSEFAIARHVPLQTSTQAVVSTEQRANSFNSIKQEQQATRSFFPTNTLNKQPSISIINIKIQSTNSAPSKMSITESKELKEILEQIDEANRLHNNTCPTCMNEYSNNKRNLRKITEACGHSCCFSCLLKMNAVKSEDNPDEVVCTTCLKLEGLIRKKSDMDNKMKSNQNISFEKQEQSKNDLKANVNNYSSNSKDPLVINDSFEENDLIKDLDFENNFQKNIYNNSNNPQTNNFSSKVQSSSNLNEFDFAEQLSRNFIQNSNKMKASLNNSLSKKSDFDSQKSSSSTKKTFQESKSFIF